MIPYVTLEMRMIFSNFTNLLIDILNKLYNIDYQDNIKQENVNVNPQRDAPQDYVHNKNDVDVSLKKC